MNKAYELIDTPEKWSNDFHEIGPRTGKVCAYIAILRAYGQIEGDKIADKFRESNGILSIVNWNDSNEWQTVYETLKEQDI